MSAYSRALAENSDVYTTVNSTGNSASRSARILTHPVRNANGASTVIQCTFPLAEMERAAHSLDITLLTTIPLVLLIAGLGGAFLTDRAMRPVRHITRTAEQIGAEDLSRRLPVGSGDEFSQLADTFNAMLGRLETSFAQQRRFTADASHELKSPLTVIKANASLALRSPRSADEYVRRIEAIDKASNHMRSLVDDLLLLALADEGRLAADKEHVSITEMLREAVDSTHRPDAAQLTLDLPEIPMMLDCDRHELMRVFCNLIENALRYTPPTGTVSVTARDEGVALCVTVSDTGNGIPSEHIPHLGERFYRVEASRARTHGGSGLGLAICRSIVQAHHGDITFRSQERVGTTVVVTLPTVNTEG
jgi:heavy metal sensor kinase